MELNLVNIDNIEFSHSRMHNNILLLKSCRKGEEVAALAQKILLAKFHLIKEVIGAGSEILIKTRSPNKVLEVLQKYKWPKIPVTRWCLPIRIVDNFDLDKLVNFSKLSITEISDALNGLELRVHSFGFIPGFIYLSGLPEILQIPRKLNPGNINIENAFALGGPYAGVYSFKSPGGWNVVGQLPFALFDFENQLPSPISINDIFAIDLISKTEFKSIRANELNFKSYNATN